MKGFIAHQSEEVQPGLLCVQGVIGGPLRVILQAERLSKPRHKGYPLVRRREVDLYRLLIWAVCEHTASLS